ncbi:MAG: zinc-ribbon domain-containing protein [Clostridia bacterium]|nr:zinc-ribbon domain-containing protein [Clostridia bacterium]
MAEIINQTAPNVRRYYTVCFNCGAGFVYRATEVHHNPLFNSIVAGRGFAGYDGEVRCPGCHTVLPHYEQNVYREDAERKERPVCPECGQTLEPGSRFCSRCGCRIEA